QRPTVFPIADGGVEQRVTVQSRGAVLYTPPPAHLSRLQTPFPSCGKMGMEPSHDGFVGNQGHDAIGVAEFGLSKIEFERRTEPREDIVLPVRFDPGASGRAFRFRRRAISIKDQFAV